MSQEKPIRPSDDQDQHDPITYGDVFLVQGEMASHLVTPEDAAMMQIVENALLGRTQKGGAASVLQAAAARNERAGFVKHDENIIDAANDHGMTSTNTKLAGNTITTGLVANVQELPEKQRNISKLAEVVGQNQRVPSHNMTSPKSVQQGGGGGITIGEALEATALTAGDKPVEWSDAAAIQAAEVRATGRTNIVPGGVAAAAQSAATLNARATSDAEKTKLADILTDATSKLPSDKPATRRDAEGVAGAEMRNDPNLMTHPRGVAASVAAAARLNQTNN